MNKYCGQVRGQSETVASRRGSEDSGLRVPAQSYDGSVIIVMHDDKVTIEIADGVSSFYGQSYFHGTIEELKERLLKE